MGMNITQHIPNERLTRGGHVIGATGGDETAVALDEGVDILGAGGDVGRIVVGDIVDLVPGDEVRGDDPGTTLDDLIDPSTVPNRFGTLPGRETGQGLVLVAILVRRHTNDELHVRKGEFRLAQLKRMPKVEQVVYAYECQPTLF